MIGSFWNLCRACPSMPVDKLHSEYRSTYRWHEFTGNSRPEIVRRPPIPNQTSFGPINEPPLPRRKKCPELAYKSHEFIIGSELRSDSRNDVVVNRARSEERGTTPSRRSKSEGPPAVPNGRAHPIASELHGAGIGNSTVQAGESSGLFKKTISKLSTEYRIQFVWPNVRKSIKGKTNIGVELPKKSQSMGALKSSQTNAMPTVHKKRTANQKEATLHELEPLVNNVEERKPAEKLVTIVEKKSTRPFSQTFDHDRNNHFITKRENFGFEKEKSTVIEDVIDNKNIIANGHCQEQWFKDVIELRKKAGEYKSRGWGMEIHPELYKKQKDLWDQVSKRSSLSALSLATSVHRPITKEEKEQENNKKSIPIKSLSKPRVPGQAHLVDNKDETILPSRFNTVRHHLERTTGPDIEEGALLPSPTREKLMPAITKRESESQRGSPKKSAASRHGSPQKGSPQKGSPKKTIKARSQSVGPGFENESPKRQMRSASTAPAAPKSGKKTPVSTPTTAHAISVERKPRPYDGDEKDSSSPHPVPEVSEPIVKSPPEPTRVKSPEQIIMRSPDPVNWTVPLDTGKTFTVTQNVKEGLFLGETYSRPQSEIKASTPVDRPPPAPQSAPPELTQQIKMDAWKNSDLSDPKTSLLCSPTGGNMKMNTFGPQQQRYDKPVPGTTIRCLDDPSFNSDTLSTSSSVNTARNTATDVLEKARDRFDRFWGGNKEDNV